MLSLLAALAVAASFPLPSLDGKALATVPDQKVFRLPSRFERIRDFYTQEFKGQADVTLKAEGTAGQRALVITSRRKGDTWKKATVKEGALETVVEVVPVIRLADETIDGSGKPLVELILMRSPEVQKALETIDHAPSR